MAGDWIKMECCTPEKSEVLAVTARLGWDDADLTVGKLFRLWRWFDQHTADGNADGVTSALLDRIVGVTGFCEALTQVGWLCVNECGISLPNFDRHNGNTAKKRAQTAKRVAKHKSNAKSNDKGNDDSVSDALPREEKRREDTSSLRSEVEAPRKRAVKAKKPMASVNDLMAFGFTPEVAAEFIAYKAEVKAPLTQRAWQDHLAEARKASMTPVQAAEKVMARSWKGFEAKYVANDRASLVPGQRNEHKHAAAARAIFDGVFDE